MSLNETDKSLHLRRLLDVKLTRATLNTSYKFILYDCGAGTAEQECFALSDNHWKRFFAFRQPLETFLRLQTTTGNVP